MKFPVSILVAGNLSSAAADPSSRQVRFMALGEPPPFRQIVRDGVRYEQEPPPGSIPPRSVELRFGGDDPEIVPLQLGRISPATKAPAGEGPLVLSRRDLAGDTAPWIKLTRPEAGGFLVLLWRDANTGSWEKARCMVLPDDPTSRPAGTVRFVNVSAATVRVVIGSEKLVLVAGRSFARTISPGGEQTFQILLPDRSGEWKPLHSGVLTQNSGERSLVLIYRADGESPRRPLKVSVQRERVPVATPNTHHP
jgi:hypothetical protein